MEALKPCRTYCPCDECPYGTEKRDYSGDDSMCQICEFAKLLNRYATPADPQESEALDIIESLLDVADMKCTGPLYADDPPRSGMCRIPEEDAVKLRQYIADRRAKSENESRVENCHVYEPGEDVETIADNCEVLIKGADLQKLTAAPENKPQQLCDEDENFIQTKFGYCFYTFDVPPIIYNLYVHPQYRRCGHSHELLKLVIAEIRKSGYEGEIRIDAEPKENSIGLADLMKYYKNMGLTIRDARKPEGSMP